MIVAQLIVSAEIGSAILDPASSISTEHHMLYAAKVVFFMKLERHSCPKGITLAYVPTRAGISQ